MEQKTICLVGLGYVGLPLAALFSTKYRVIGFDLKESRINELKAGRDTTDEVADIKNYPIEFTTDPAKIKEADLVVVAVPTPINQAKDPDLTPLIKASEVVGRNLKTGAIVTYESTVYPGCTEEICLPILERESGKKLGIDFKLGYSPERVNPGDREHTIDKVVKVVGASDEAALSQLVEFYGSVIPAGIHRASSLKVAEAVKVVENVKRDLNIALVNELALIFARMNISTREVLAAAGTKWNFNSGHFFPGLVGGHCIGIDPYYLVHKSLELGHHPQLILASRAVNECMARHVAEMILKDLIKAKKTIGECLVLVMGLTFKENVRDSRNSKAKDVIECLKDFGLKVFGCDPMLTNETVAKEFGTENIDFKNTDLKFDAILVFSPHQQFKEMSLSEIKSKVNDPAILFDLKAVYERGEAEEVGFAYRAL